MRTFYYIEQWRYYHPRLFPTLNLLLFPAQTYGNQPDGLRPHYSDQTNAFIDNAPIPSPDLVEEEALMDELVETHLPEPHHHVARSVT